MDNNNARLVGIAFNAKTLLPFMFPRSLWSELCSYENLKLAFKKARKHKTLKPYVIEFEKNLEDNLLTLRAELLLHAYRPEPLKIFVIRDPKVRVISKSAFRDRVVHHALCNIIEPIFEKLFIYDSYANRIGKGTIAAINRFEYFKRKASKNNIVPCWAIKADLRHYFETVIHELLLQTLKKKIKDAQVLGPIRIILSNHMTKTNGRGMPLGNLTSQFFANVYLNALDQFVKHKLKVKYYIRYVDDFVILDINKNHLESILKVIEEFLKKELSLELHQQKTKIIKLEQGVNLLGLRCFYYHRLLRKSNKRKYLNKLNLQINQQIPYDVVYESFQGWWAHAKLANTYKLRTKVSKMIERNFPQEISSAEISRLSKLRKEK